MDLSPECQASKVVRGRNAESAEDAESRSEQFLSALRVSALQDLHQRRAEHCCHRPLVCPSRECKADRFQSATRAPGAGFDVAVFGYGILASTVSRQSCSSFLSCCVISGRDRDRSLRSPMSFSRSKS